MERREYEPTEQITITLEAREWNLVFLGLGELPLKVAGALNAKLQAQIEAGTTPVQRAGNGGVHASKDAS